MTAENFNQILQRLALDRPFRPFMVELLSGEKFEVDFPTAITVRGGLAVFVALGGVPIIFDHQGVLAIDGGAASASAQEYAGVRTLELSGMKDSDIIVMKEPKLSLGDQFYIPQVLIGLGTTMKHMFQVVALGQDRVVQYPEERREDLPVEKGGMYTRTYRGVHRLNKDEEGRVKCVACFMCSTACPARCIHIEAAESPWADREKYPAKFDIDELRCIYCGMCEEACPVDAIELTHVYDIVGLTRQEMIFDKSKLLQVFDQTVKSEPM